MQNRKGTILTYYILEAGRGKGGRSGNSSSSMTHREHSLTLCMSICCYGDLLAV